MMIKTTTMYETETLNNCNASHNELTDQESSKEALRDLSFRVYTPPKIK